MNCRLIDFNENLQVRLFGSKNLNGETQPGGTLLRENLSTLIMSSRVTSSSIAIWRCSGSIELVIWLVVLPVHEIIIGNIMLINYLHCADRRCRRTILQLWKLCLNVLHRAQIFFEAENDFKFSNIAEYRWILKVFKHLDYLKHRLVFEN